MGFLAWGIRAMIRAPPPKICGSPGGPPVAAPRVKLRDGRHLAYKEHGVPRELAKHKIIFVHGISSCRHDAVIATQLSPVLLVMDYYLFTSIGFFLLFTKFQKVCVGEVIKLPNCSV